MYPNQAPQQNLGFYVPPPMNFDNAPGNNNLQTHSSSLGDMLQNLMNQKPSFSTNLFSGQDKIYQSKYKWFIWEGYYSKIKHINILIKMILKEFSFKS